MTTHEQRLTSLERIQIDKNMTILLGIVSEQLKEHSVAIKAMLTQLTERE
jgi:hypothetical protein